MKISYLLMALSSGAASTIKNINLPACRNCIHYKHSIVYSFGSDLNKCHKFGVKDIISDEITYDFADLCRKDENKCGIEGRHFEQNEYVNLKYALHLMTKSSPFLFIVGLSILKMWISLHTQLP